MNDDDLRQLFEDATADIRPQGTLEDIRAQTKKVDPMARRWFLPSLAAAAAMALVIGGAFWMTRDTDSDTAGPATSPTATATASDDPTTVVPPMADVTLYYVGEGARGPRLFSEQQKVDSEDRATSALAQATGGQAFDPDYKSYWPSSIKIESVSFDGVGDSGSIGIRLSAAAADRPTGTSAKQALMQVDAIVRTAQEAFSAKASVDFYVDTERQDRVLGVDTSSPQTGGNDDDVLALVSIDNLVDGATVPAGKLTVTGMASAFEATVSWEILLGGDAAIDQGNTMATECCTLKPYSFTTNIALAPGRYTVVVHDNDESGQGRPVNRDTKEIVVE